jgi:preprotein translocase subunit SecF
MIAIPTILSVIFSIAILVRGIPVGMEFTGGTLVRVRGLDTPPDLKAIEPAVENFLGTKVDIKITEDRTRSTGRFGLDLETDKVLSEEEKADLLNFLGREFGMVGSYSAEWFGSILTGIYREQARRAIIAAVIAMAIIIFITFRHSLIVGAILLCLGLDMLGTFGCMAIFRVPLTLASIAGLLMLIGYAVDTNILLSVQTAKRLGGEARERIASAMKTGLMMSGTTVLAMFMINILTVAPALYQLSSVLIFGILVDIVNTWFLNAGILLWHLSRIKEGVYVSE